MIHFLGEGLYRARRETSCIPRHVARGRCRAQRRTRGPRARELDAAPLRVAGPADRVPDTARAACSRAQRTPSITPKSRAALADSHRGPGQPQPGPCVTKCPADSDSGLPPSPHPPSLPLSVAVAIAISPTIARTRACCRLAASARPSTRRLAPQAERGCTPLGSFPSSPRPLPRPPLPCTPPPSPLAVSKDSRGAKQRARGRGRDQVDDAGEGSGAGKGPG